MSTCNKLLDECLDFYTSQKNKKGEVVKNVTKSASKKESDGFRFECHVRLNLEKTVIVRSNKTSEFWEDINVAFNQSIFRDFVGLQKLGSDEILPPHTNFVSPGSYTLVSRTHSLDDEQLDGVIRVAVEKLKAFRPLMSKDVLQRLEEELLLLYTHFSLSHEGNSLGLDETRLLADIMAAKDWKHEEEEEEEKVSDSKHDLAEAINHIVISQTLHETAEAPLTETVVLDLHSVLMRGLLHNKEEGLPGEYRKVPVRVSGCDMLRPHPDYLEYGMADYFADTLPREDGEPIFDYLARIHTEFQSLHPFRDGNGRIGRLIMNILLLQHGYPLLVLPTTLSPMFNHAVGLGVIGSHRGIVTCNKLFSRLCAEAVFGSLQAYEKALGEQLLPTIEDLLGEENVTLRGPPVVVSP